MSDNPITVSIRREIRDPNGNALAVLCIEDNEGDFVLLRTLLREAGFGKLPKVEKVATIAEAVERLTPSDPKKFDIVLLDLSLPDSQGAESYLRVRKANHKLPIIILSGNSDQELAEKIVIGGAQDYLPKDGLTSDMLKRSIIYSLSRQRYREGIELVADRLRRANQDLQEVQAQLARTEKLDSISRLAGSVAHEVKNPLATIQMGLDMLKNRIPPTDPLIAATLTHMQDAVDNADRIIQEMLGFSRDNGTVEFRPVCLNDLVRRSLRMLHHEMDRRHFQWECHLDNGIPKVLADENKIEQVLINLVMNSMQATGSHGKIKIRTYESTAERVPRIEGNRDLNRLRDGDRVVVVDIRDHGGGIPTEQLGRVLDPFFTTKPPGEGTGLGLAVCESIIGLHRGHLLLDNEVDPAGLRVRVLLRVPD
ncbi:MAG: response regulator [Verrucomicrobiae bacterium]|nr:response regulator [Verrucomicrobiae bacterium]